MQPTVGRIVHYALPTGPSGGELRPAVIVAVGVKEVEDTEVPVIELQVFTSKNDDLPQVYHASDVQEGTEPGTWQWPAKQS